MPILKKCIVISDSFKGLLSSTEICQIARETIPAFFPECQVAGIPVADGGEGTVDCFIEAIGVEPVTILVQGPIGEPVQPSYARKGGSRGAKWLPRDPAGHRRQRHQRRRLCCGTGRAFL